MNPVLVNVAMGGRYPPCQDKLVQSFRDHGFMGNTLLFTNELPPGCPPHGTNHQYDPNSDSVPYAFKAYAMHQAWEKGYDMIIWCDAVYQLLKPINELYEDIVKDSYMFMPCGWTLGEWCCDSAIPALGTTRDAVMKMNQLQASVMCLDMNQVPCWAFLEMYYRYAVEKTAFRGPWTNNNGEASADPRVKGHRHDQTVASFLANKLGMIEWKSGYMKYDRTQIDENTMFLAQ